METLSRPAMRLKLRPTLGFIYAFIACSMVYGFWFMFNMDGYLPWHTRLAKAINATLQGHFGLWLATIKIQGKLRFVSVAILLPTMIGIFYLWWTLHLAAAIIALGCMSWLLFRVVMEK
ncbi:MAG TPA: hypothetical protein VIH99_07085 [Bdellovibrionota bacterium]